MHLLLKSEESHDIRLLHHSFEGDLADPAHCNVFGELCILIPVHPLHSVPYCYLPSAPVRLALSVLVCIARGTDRKEISCCQQQKTKTYDLNAIYSDRFHGTTSFVCALDHGTTAWPAAVPVTRTDTPHSSPCPDIHVSHSIRSTCRSHRAMPPYIHLYFLFHYNKYT